MSRKLHTQYSKDPPVYHALFPEVPQAQHTLRTQPPTQRIHDQVQDVERCGTVHEPLGY